MTDQPPVAPQDPRLARIRRSAETSLVMTDPRFRQEREDIFRVVDVLWLLDRASLPSAGETAAVLAEVERRITEAAPPRHGGSMVPHGSASDCRKCESDRILRIVRAYAVEITGSPASATAGEA